MKLISWELENGEEGWCGARCYNSTSSKCYSCICRGKNHGVGRDKAIFLTRALAHEWIANKKNIKFWTVASIIVQKKRDSWCIDDSRFKLPPTSEEKRRRRSE